MARATLTPKQKKFVNKYVETGNGTQSALEAYDLDSPTVAATIASENIRKPNVRAQIESYAKRAAERVEALAESAKSEYVKLQANVDILDRAGLAPQEEKVQQQNIVIMISGDASGRYATNKNTTIGNGEENIPSATLVAPEGEVAS